MFRLTLFSSATPSLLSELRFMKGKDELGGRGRVADKRLLLPRRRQKREGGKTRSFQKTFYYKNFFESGSFAPLSFLFSFSLCSLCFTSCLPCEERKRQCQCAKPLGAE